MEYSTKLIYVPPPIKHTSKYYSVSKKTDNYQPDSQKKYNNNRNTLSLKRLIFPPISNEKIHQLLIDDESIKFITFYSSAQEITNIIMNNLLDFPCPDREIKNIVSLDTDVKNPISDLTIDEYKKWNNKSPDKKMSQLVITEMTAGVGGNVLNFAKYFKYVNAIEIDTVRYNYLRKNIELYEYNNVNCYNEDSVSLLIEKDDIGQDIIFFDPPWGGKDYKLHVNLRLKFGQFSIENVCKILFQRSDNKMIVMKLPNNYDFDFLNDELKEYRVHKFILERMTIIIVKNYQCENDI